MRAPREFVSPDAIAGVVRDRVILKAATFLIDRPGDMEELLDLPSVRTAFSEDDYMPYWADIWPASRMLSRAILEANWAPGLKSVELGCGLGLAGIAALSRGIHVTFSDYDLTAVAFAMRNAKLNGFPFASARPFDWRDPPTDLQVPLVFGADLIYQERNFEPLLNTLETVLQPRGECWLTDADRPTAPGFLQALESKRWTIRRRAMRAGSPGQARVKGTLYRIHRPDEPAA